MPPLCGPRAESAGCARAAGQSGRPAASRLRALRSCANSWIETARYNAPAEKALWWSSIAALVGGASARQQAPTPAQPCGSASAPALPRRCVFPLKSERPALRPVPMTSPQGLMMYCMMLLMRSFNAARTVWQRRQAPQHTPSASPSISLPSLLHHPAPAAPAPPPSSPHLSPRPSLRLPARRWAACWSTRTGPAWASWPRACRAVPSLPCSWASTTAHAAWCWAARCASEPLRGPCGPADTPIPFRTTRWRAPGSAPCLTVLGCPCTCWPEGGPAGLLLDLPGGGRGRHLCAHGRG